MCAGRTAPGRRPFSARTAVSQPGKPSASLPRPNSSDPPHEARPSARVNCAPSRQCPTAIHASGPARFPVQFAVEETFDRQSRSKPVQSASAAGALLRARSNAVLCAFFRVPLVNPVFGISGRRTSCGTELCPVHQLSVATLPSWKQDSVGVRRQLEISTLGEWLQQKCPHRRDKAAASRTRKKPGKLKKKKERERLSLDTVSCARAIGE